MKSFNLLVESAFLDFNSFSSSVKEAALALALSSLRFAMLSTSRGFALATATASRISSYSASCSWLSAVFPFEVATACFVSSYSFSSCVSVSVYSLMSCSSLSTVSSRDSSSDLIFSNFFVSAVTFFFKFFISSCIFILDGSFLSTSAARSTRFLSEAFATLLAALASFLVVRSSLALLVTILFESSTSSFSSSMLVSFSSISVFI
mmetsp:Transcript_13933/g.16935  ORF Transcript_13933/g.16935 Transcript_13933/m.16935 type:complete len:206 (-) Transcript_13933:979-1596(-)